MSREMKDSGVEWIGEIPKNWNVQRVKNAFVRKKACLLYTSDAADD